MKSKRKIFIAFILNLLFAIIEFIGGSICGSVAIISDSLHDAGDAMSIGISYFMEKKSGTRPNEKYTFGYARYSVIGSVITLCILILGSVAFIINAVERIIYPVEIHYDYMLIFAIFGVCINFIAVIFTHGGKSLNQRAVNLHMLEDCLGWIVVLIGAIIMKLTDIALIDPIMSIGVSVFILISSVKAMKESISVLLQKVPSGICTDRIKEHLEEIEGVVDIHHIHVWSLDGERGIATLHARVSDDAYDIKAKIKNELAHFGVAHSTVEIEYEGEECRDILCSLGKSHGGGCCHHHH